MEHEPHEHDYNPHRQRFTSSKLLTTWPTYAQPDDNELIPSRKLTELAKRLKIEQIFKQANRAEEDDQSRIKQGAE
eukprot:scaffold276030_cov35-Tisochrysis_lutea.AAC.3